MTADLRDHTDAKMKKKEKEEDIPHSYRHEEPKRLHHVRGRLASEHATEPLRGGFELLDEKHGRGEVLAFRELSIARRNLLGRLRRPTTTATKASYGTDGHRRQKKGGGRRMMCVSLRCFPGILYQSKPNRRHG